VLYQQSLNNRVRITRALGVSERRIRFPPLRRLLEGTPPPGECSLTICSRRAENPGGSHEAARLGEHSSRYQEKKDRSQKKGLR